MVLEAFHQVSSKEDIWFKRFCLKKFVGIPMGTNCAPLVANFS